MRDSEKIETVNHRGSISMQRNKKLSIEEKVRLARRCLQGEISDTEAAREAGIGRATAARWTRQYEAEGIEAFRGRSNREYAIEMKRKAVADYVAGKGSQSSICKKYKIKDERQLRNWVRVYNAHGDFNSRKGSGGGSYMKQGRSTTQEERIQIAKECLESGKNYGEMALKYNVSYQQARTWTLRFEEFGEAGLEDRRGKRKKDQTPRTELERLQIENEQLKHKLYLAEMERDLLKKLEEIERRDASQE